MCTTTLTRALPFFGGCPLNVAAASWQLRKFVPVVGDGAEEVRVQIHGAASVNHISHCLAPVSAEFSAVDGPRLHRFRGRTNSQPPPRQCPVRRVNGVCIWYGFFSGEKNWEGER